MSKQPDLDLEWVDYGEGRIVPIYTDLACTQPSGESYAILRCVHNGSEFFQVFVEKSLDENDLIRLKKEHSSSLIAFAEAYKDDKE